MTEPGAESGLRRQMGLASATAAVVGEIVAIGVFLTPAAMLKGLGSPLLALAAWLVMAAMALCGALCYGELAARFPRAGGGYVYLREAFGGRVAFLYGWKCLLVLDPGIAAAMAVGAAGYSAQLAPLSAGGEKLLAIAILLALAAGNALGVRLGAAVTRGLTALKLALLGALVLWGFGRGLGDWSNFVPLAERAPGSPPLGAALASAMLAAFYAFGGWWDLAKLGEEVREPERTIPRALVLGVLATTVVYVLTSAAFLYLVPASEVESDAAFAARAGRALFGASGERVFAGVVLVCVVGSLAVLVMAAPRVYFAMARDGLFLSSVARVHPRTGTPLRAIALQATLASGMVLLGTFDAIVGTFLFVTVLFIALTVAGGVRLRALGAERGWPWAHALFLALSAVLLALIFAARPWHALGGLALVSLGLPVHVLVARRAPRGAA